MANDTVVEFHVNFDKCVTLLADRMDEFDRHVALALAENVIVGGDVSPGTPVDTGFARNSWVVSLGDPGNARQPPKNPDPKGNVSVLSVGEAQTALLDLKGDAVVWITSNCEYMLVIEYGAVNRAPVGMVALTVAGAQQIVDRVASEMLR